MKKIVKLIPLLVAPLMMSSCIGKLFPFIPGGSSGGNSQGGSSGSASGSWGSTIEAEMRQYLDTVLPYAPLNTSSLQHGLDDSYASLGITIYYIYDDNETDVLANYGSSLTSAGWTKEEDEYGEYYAKTTSKGSLECVFGWVEADEDYAAGNSIQVYIGGEEGGGGGEGYTNSVATDIGENLDMELEYDSDYECWSVALDVGEEGTSYTDTKAGESLLKPAAEGLLTYMPSYLTQKSAKFYASSEDYWEDESGDTAYEIVLEGNDAQVYIISYVYRNTLVGQISVYGEPDEGGSGGGGTPVTDGDTLNPSTLSLDGSTTYNDYTYSTSNASYSANCANGNDSIQLRSKNNTSGVIASGKNGKKCSAITFKFEATTASGVSARTLDIYGSNSAFSIADMYTMTPVGTLSCNQASGTYTFTTQYQYVGFRSDNGAIYITSATFAWGE